MGRGSLTSTAQGSTWENQVISNPHKPVRATCSCEFDHLLTATGQQALSVPSLCCLRPQHTHLDPSLTLRMC